ncbi:hypothetical protein CYMTET_51054 [Cymbomonas tetramitiformis]|uniref:BED-type domain-containing protein n=1 Tax=Cymbomonas tetramitiformis TaxID=36881 RepID=A0AAE0BNF4_9CHLO|nr:hypothetical protein CYMTET_51054 [Cymbomonas tetramitiformis]
MPVAARPAPAAAPTDARDGTPLGKNADTWEPEDNLPGYATEIAEFRESRAREVATNQRNSEAHKKEAENRKRERAADEEESSDLVEAKKGKTKRRSLAWDHFWLKKNDETDKVDFIVCKLCGPNSEPIPFSGNTSNLRSHLAHAHKDVFCKLCVDEKGEKDRPPSGRSGDGESSESLPTAGTITAMLPKGGYTPPGYQLVVQKILLLSAEASVRVHDALEALFEEGILPSIAGDIWSQGGIAIFGILVYWLDIDFVLHEKLVSAIPFSDVRHNGLEISKATKIACAKMGIGRYEVGDDEVVKVDTVASKVHCTASDSASNIVSGWGEWDGHECNCHLLALCVLAFLKSEGVHKCFKKLRGMTGHFHHSVIGVKLLHDCQARNSLNPTSPPQDNDTRSGWGGAFKQCDWFNVNLVAIQLYDIENPRKAATAAPNPDGSVYRDHKLTDIEWDIVRESRGILAAAATCVDLLQGTKYCTANLVMPLIGHLAYKMHKDTVVKFEGEVVHIMNESVKAARENLYKDICKRHYDCGESKGVGQGGMGTRLEAEGNGGRSHCRGPSCEVAEGGEGLSGIFLR